MDHVYPHYQSFPTRFSPRPFDPTLRIPSAFFQFQYANHLHHNLLAPFSPPSPMRLDCSDQVLGTKRHDQRRLLVQPDASRFAETFFPSLRWCASNSSCYNVPLLAFLNSSSNTEPADNPSILIVTYSNSGGCAISCTESQVQGRACSSRYIVRSNRQTTEGSRASPLVLTASQVVASSQLWPCSPHSHDYANVSGAWSTSLRGRVASRPTYSSLDEIS